MSNLSLLGPALIGAFVAARAISKRGQPSAAAQGPKAVPVDPAQGDAELAALQRAVTARDWPAAAGILGPCRERGDFERLTWLISGVEEIGEDFLLTLPEQHPEDPLVRTVSGARHVAWAWEARTGARASQVTEDQFRTFHERLGTAEEHLYAAVEADPESAAPWVFLTTASRGLEHGHAVTRRRFEAGLRRAPQHVGLHTAQLQQICRKWGGSHEEMHAFARAAREQAPAGSGLGVLTAYAHLEHWLDLPRGEDAAYMCTAEVRTDLRQAALGSVLHPAYAPTSSAKPALNAFAMALWLANERAFAWDLFQRIGDQPTRFPWAYAGAPGKVFAQARQDCTKSKKGKPQ